MSRAACRGSLHRVERPGQGPSVVFLHGLGGTHRYWTAASPADDAYHSIYLDLLGFGDSPRPLIRYTIGRHLAALHDSISPDAPVVLVGHSLGAALALIYAARHPEQVQALVLIGLPHYGDSPSVYRWLRRHPPGWFMTNMVVTAATCVITRRLLGRVLPYLLRNYPREVAEDLVKHNLMSSTTSLWEVLYRHDLTGDADTTPDHIPVLCLHGTNDTTAPFDQVQRLAFGRTNWQVRSHNGGDHHPWLRDHDACAAAITEIAALVVPGGDATARGRSSLGPTQTPDRGSTMP